MDQCMTYANNLGVIEHVRWNCTSHDDSVETIYDETIALKPCRI